MHARDASKTDCRVVSARILGMVVHHLNYQQQQQQQQRRRRRRRLSNISLNTSSITASGRPGAVGRRYEFHSFTRQVSAAAERYTLDGRPTTGSVPAAAADGGADGMRIMTGQ